MSGYAHTIRETLKKIQDKKQYKFFIETGTFKGDTTVEASKLFNHVISIELKDSLFYDAQSRFRNVKNIQLFKGESSSVLRDVLDKIHADAVFFLDAHWAGDLSTRTRKDTPLIDELSVIKEKRIGYKDLIIIDDYGWVGKKEKIVFKKEWKSKYFPEGGEFIYDWTDISDDQIRKMFKGKEIYLQDDRLFIHT